MTNQAYLAQIFNSFQGEGQFAGTYQTFLRFSECNLSCAYCDTSASQKRLKQYLIELQPGKRKQVRRENPVTSDKLLKLLSPFLRQKGIESLSITGGEPLVQSAFLAEFLPMLIKKYPKLAIHLETNGTLDKSLKTVFKYLDFISMDIKLESTAKIKGLWLKHERFLRTARPKPMQVKLVVSQQTTINEVRRAAMMVGRHSKRIPIILQPITGRPEQVPSMKKLGTFYKEASKFVKTVYVLPQLHKLLGLL